MHDPDQPKTQAPGVGLGSSTGVEKVEPSSEYNAAGESHLIANSSKKAIPLPTSSPMMSSGSLTFKPEEPKPGQLPRMVSHEIVISEQSTECLYQGIVVGMSGEHVCSSFIKASQGQCSTIQFQELRRLGANCHHILTPREFFTSIDRKQYWFVTDPVHTVRGFFQRKLIDFLNQKEQWPVDKLEALNNWWNTIKTDIIAILRDISKGYFFLASEERLNVAEFYVMVNDNKIRGKVLPFTQLSRSFAEDLGPFLDELEEIIVPPCSNCKLTDLPEEIQKYLSFLKKNRHYGPLLVCWVFDHPFLWSSAEKVAFLKQLAGLKKNVAASHIVLQLGVVLKDEYFKCESWQYEEYIKDDLLCAIMKPKTEGVIPYNSDDGIFRFIGNVFSHANERDYQEIRKGYRLKEHEIESRLLLAFPGIYEAIKDGLLVIRDKKIWNDNTWLNVTGLYLKPMIS